MCRYPTLAFQLKAIRQHIHHLAPDFKRGGCGWRRYIADVNHTFAVDEAEVIEQVAVAVDCLCAYA